MIGETISHYKILEKIGEGGMGVVYKAMDTKLKRAVALKFLSPGTLAGDEERARFVREAQTAAALRHPGICTVYEIDEADGRSFIVMEFIEGQSLKERIAAGPLDLNEAAGIVTRLADALDEAHAKGIVHRDIKPANVMLTPEGQAVLTDFGLAKSAGSDKVTKTGTTIGTVAYMSPEQARGEDVDRTTDIWSLGVVLYEMLTGTLPFKGEFEPAVIYSILNSDPERPGEIKRGIPGDVEGIVLKALEKNPTLRPRSASGIGDVLARHSQGGFRVPRSEQPAKAFLKGSRRLAVVIPVVVAACLLCLLAVNYMRNVQHSKWARDEALPQISQLVEGEEYTAAYVLAKQAREFIPSDHALTKLWSEMTEVVSIHSSPEGAEVFFKQYKDDAGEWISLGRTPFDSLAIPRDFLRWKIEMEGYETLEAAGGSDLEDLRFVLSESGTLPEGMVLVPGGSRRLRLMGLYDPQRVELTNFYIDRFEVTNGQFQAFVDSGGYQRREFWKQKFFKDGGELSWDEAMSLFEDSTGRPGPSTWELGRYLEGREDFPVTGVSWYEAAAYAEFAGKTLPTVAHWAHAATIRESGQIIPLSNFGGEDLAQVGSHQGLGYFGTYDMAGNAREWCFNSSGDSRYVLGGSWNDPLYMFFVTQDVDAFDRSERNGFRCVMHAHEDSSLVAAREILPRYEGRDYSTEEPVSDEVFEAYLEAYAFEKTPLNAEVEFVDNEPEFWTIEKISYDAGYGGERVFAYLFLPRDVFPPYQVLVLFPGSYAFEMKSSENGRRLNSWDAVDFIIKSGRAVLCPVYRSCYERWDGFHPYRDGPPTSSAYTERFLMWTKDLSSSLDYLETRPDIDTEKIGFVGSSWGAWTAPMFLGREGRFKVAVLRLGGFLGFHLPPAFDPFNFTPRIRIPVLMLNGKYDYMFPYHSSQLPMFETLGTPPEDKRLVLFETDHTVHGYRNMMIRETLDWLDRYLGPVK